VHIDEAWQEGDVSEIDDGRAWNRGWVAFRYRLNFVAGNNHHGVIHHTTGCRVEKPARADHNWRR
jgi:hypothetical protein